MIDKDMQQGQYLKVLENIHTSLFPGMSLVKILYNETYYCQDWKYSLLEIIKTITLRPYSLQIDCNGHEILCLSTKYYRCDHDEYWNKIKSDSGTHDDIIICVSSGKDINRIEWINLFRKAFWFITALIELSCINENKNKVYLALQLVRRKWVLEKLKKLNLKPKVVMCFFDSSPDENVLMQYYKQQGAITITNQHGQSLYRSINIDRVNQSQILNFKCDYYFAKGEMQVKQFIKAGYDENQFRCIGIVDGEKPKVELHKTGYFGVYLDCPGYSFADVSNIKLINLAKKIANVIKMKYLIKLHPIEDSSKYVNCTDENCIGMFGCETNLSDTFNKIEFGIIHASATYVDVYFHGLRCFKYVTDVNFPIAYSEDEFYDFDDMLKKLEYWNNLNDIEKKRYIAMVRKMYDSGWKKGDIEFNIKKICESNNKV